MAEELSWITLDYTGVLNKVATECILRHAALKYVGITVLITVRNNEEHNKKENQVIITTAEAGHSTVTYNYIEFINGARDQNFDSPVLKSRWLNPLHKS